jgi:predicted nucleic acid-binding protein
VIVVADTGPLNYLILIGHVEVLKGLHGQVVIPTAVQDEMLDALAPPAVKAWMRDPPQWVQVRSPSRFLLMLDSKLGDGEREAITLAYAEGIEESLLLIERRGRREAARLGLSFTGTLGILEQAAKRGLLDLRQAIERLRKTNFKVSAGLLDDFLRR